MLHNDTGVGIVGSATTTKDDELLQFNSEQVHLHLAVLNDSKIAYGGNGRRLSRKPNKGLTLGSYKSKKQKR